MQQATASLCLHQHVIAKHLVLNKRHELVAAYFISALQLASAADDMQRPCLTP
jgi:hypothetical protein